MKIFPCREGKHFPLLDRIVFHTFSSSRLGRKDALVRLGGQTQGLKMAALNAKKVTSFKYTDVTGGKGQDYLLRRPNVSTYIYN